MHPVLELGVLRAGVNVDHRCLYENVPELILAGHQMRPAMKKVGSQTLPQKTRVNALLEARAPGRRANQLAQVLLRVRPAAAETDEQEIHELAPAIAQILGQQAHARRGDVRVTVLLSFGGLDVQRRPPRSTSRIRSRQSSRLRSPAYASVAIIARSRRLRGAAISSVTSASDKVPRTK